MDEKEIKDKWDKHFEETMKKIPKIIEVRVDVIKDGEVIANIPAHLNLDGWRSIKATAFVEFGAQKNER